MAVEGALNSLQDKHYAVIFDVVRAVQHGTVFSPAVDKAGKPRGNYVTSGIPANAIIQIRTGNGQVLNPNTLGTAEWHSRGPVDVPSNMPTTKVSGRAEMPSLEVYHSQLSLAEDSRWSRTLRSVQTLVLASFVILRKPGVRKHSPSQGL